MLEEIAVRKNTDEPAAIDDGQMANIEPAHHVRSPGHVNGRRYDEDIPVMIAQVCIVRLAFLFNVARS